MSNPSVHTNRADLYKLFPISTIPAICIYPPLVLFCPTHDHIRHHGFLIEPRGLPRGESRPKKVGRDIQIKEIHRLRQLRADLLL